MQDHDIERLLQEASDAFQRGAFTRAGDLWGRILDEHPNHEDALAGYLHANMQRGRNKQNIAAAKRAYDAVPDDVRILNTYLDVLIMSQHQSEAFEIATKALEKFPDNVHLRVKVCNCLLGFGELDKAREELWEAHELDPSASDPLYLLARIGNKEDLAALKKPLETLWHTEDDHEPVERANIGFAYASLLEKLGEFDEAWNIYVAANALQLPFKFFDEPGYVRTANQNIEMFGRRHAPPPGDEAPGHNLIFIVSLPRSGSTLTEQILGSHPRTSPIGERALAQECADIWMAQPSSAGLEQARRHYMDGAFALADCEEGEDVIIVDKSIYTYFLVGLLRMVFPGAKFVHIVRSPLDAAVSCFATPFGPNALQWCSDLDTIARTFRQYQRVMKVWMRTDRGDLKTFSYEDLVSDPVHTTRELIEFCGLSWEPACLDFHKADSKISTASAAQVREPIYQTSKGRAAHFEKHLGPLKRILGRAASPDWYKSAQARD